MAQFIVPSLEDNVTVRLKPRAARRTGRIGVGAYPHYNAAGGTSGTTIMAEQI